MGLLNAVELVEDKDSRTPLNEAGVTGLTAHAFENGVILGRNGNTIPGRCNILLISPPLILDRGDADKIVEAVASGLGAPEAFGTGLPNLPSSQRALVDEHTLTVLDATEGTGSPYG